MTLSEALKVLGLKNAEDIQNIKKRYRKLMHIVHPDAAGNSREAYRYSAHEINAAYEILSKVEEERLKAELRSGKSPAEDEGGIWNEAKQGSGKAAARWNAPVNEAAFAERDIYQYIDGIDGVHRETFTVDTGKFFMSSDEDFKLFLLSIYNLSRDLVKDMDVDRAIKIQPELAYLLSQQFVPSENILSRYEVEKNKKARTYYIPAMLETEGRRCLAPVGTVLIPKSVRSHRLYLANEAGRELGYISFEDDRLYYAVVPLFEQRSVQVKIRVAGSVLGNNNIRQIKVKSLDLWMRMEERDEMQVSISISERIKKLLEER